LTQLNSKQGCKILRETTTLGAMAKYDKFVNNIKSNGGFIHGSQSHVTQVPNTQMFEYTIFIYYEVPRDVEVSRL
jgi:hypothetical protein